MISPVINFIGFFKLKSKFWRDLFVSEKFTNFFSKLLGKEVDSTEDYIEIEEVLCDLHNIFVSFSDIGIQKPLLSYDWKYIRTYFIDNFEHQIVQGIKIECCWWYKSDYFKVTTYDNKGKEISLEHKIDYLESGRVFYFLLNKIIKRQIHEIELSAHDVKHIKRFKISDYLCDLEL